MLHWSTKTCRETKLASRIPLSQEKRVNLFKKNRQPNSCNVSSDEKTRSVRNKSRAFQISKNGCKSSKIMQDGVMMQRNIDTDVFDWLTKNADKSLEYCVDNNSNADNSTTVRSEPAPKNQNVTNVASEPEVGTAMSGRENGLNTKAELYFSKFKSVIFPFEDKYFYVREKLNNSHTLSLTKTAKSTGDNAGYTMDDDKYKEILLGDKGDEIKEKGGLKSTEGNKGEHIQGKNEYHNKSFDRSGLNDTALYNGEQCMFTHYTSGLTGTTMYNGGEQRVSKLTSGIYSESQQKEINRLQVEIDKLSSFVESSDEHREQSEALVAEQKEKLRKHIHEKEVLGNRVRCLEELRSNLQSQVDEILEENQSLKLALKSSAEKLLKETENVKALKEDCASETAKNIELELVLQTIREELGYASSKNDTSPGTSDDVREGRDHSESRPTQVKNHIEKKVEWGGTTIRSEETKSESPPSSAEQHLRSLSTRTLKTVNHESQSTHAPHYSCLKQQTGEDEMWKHEKRQFQGKIMLLEMDKKKLRSQLEALEEKIAKQESIGENLQETNEVLEFRVFELECELMEKQPDEII